MDSEYVNHESRMFTQYQNVLSEVGFEPTPTDVDCDLNAAP